MISSPLLSSQSNLLHSFGTKGPEVLPLHLVTAGQIHGTNILFVPQAEKIERKGFDILMTDQKGIAIGVRTADCLPILMVEPLKGLVAAVHVGWRGTLARGIEKAVRKMTELGGQAEKILAALGPCISGRCYEVEKEVADLFGEKFSAWHEILKVRSQTKWLLDIAECNRKQLLAMGVRGGNIDRIDLCTHCRPDLFYSYRREGGAAGRMVNRIQLLS